MVSLPQPTCSLLISYMEGPNFRYACHGRVRCLWWRSVFKCGGLYLVVTEVVPVDRGVDAKGVLMLLRIWVGD